MSKRKQLHPDSIHKSFGRNYEDEIPDYHIEGKECSEDEYNEYTNIVGSHYNWYKSNRIKEISKSLSKRE